MVQQLKSTCMCTTAHTITLCNVPEPNTREQNDILSYPPLNLLDVNSPRYARVHIVHTPPEVLKFLNGVSQHISRHMLEHNTSSPIPLTVYQQGWPCNNFQKKLQFC